MPMVPLAHAILSIINRPPGQVNARFYQYISTIQLYNRPNSSPDKMKITAYDILVFFSIKSAPKSDVLYLYRKSYFDELTLTMSVKEVKMIVVTMSTHYFFLDAGNLIRTVLVRTKYCPHISILIVFRVSLVMMHIMALSRLNLSIATNLTIPIELTASIKAIQVHHIDDCDASFNSQEYNAQITTILQNPSGSLSI